MRLMAVVLAAGAGTRMKSDLPKVLHPVAGLPMACWAVERALASGADRVAVVLKHGRELVEPALASRYADNPRVVFCTQGPLDGTAGAVLAAREHFHDFAGSVAILYGDVPNLPQEVLDGLIRLHADAGCPMTLVTAHDPSPNRYGRIVRDADGRPLRIVEFADASAEERALQEVNVGLYLVEAAFLDRALDRIDDSNEQQEFYLTDLVAIAAAEGTPAAALVAPDIAPLHGVNRRSELARAEAWAQARLRERWMDEGVTFLAPDSVRLEVDVQLSRDVEIAGGVSLLGRTRVGSGTRIEPGCHLRDTTVGDAVTLRAGVYAEETAIGDHCAIGPWVHLRPGTQLEEGVRIGNFVETKQAVFGPGAKASHLSYIGDADVGAGANVGAGTITCNYDGQRKHRTVIGRGAFIGSDTQLVAPVTVGDGAYVGAGTTVTEDVPEGALALSRCRQRNIDGWAERKRERADNPDEPSS
ncbi:MAG: UDP-N-acetylglucosamine diphosphorylase/glucosamine-1-phosphate N-acetyltransferase [Deltaproteobacteria bacterium]|nr:MAG: UDP-N-acetylglucosamine diphosphorylase/glucosamine-1-phosphate N-acetyltransferase [Deltaproteobacteria bacterium]